MTKKDLMTEKDKSQNRILKWVLENQMISILILFAIVFLFASVIPEGGGMSFGSGSIFGNITKIGIGADKTESSTEIVLKKDTLAE
jgi:hypothetical protein